MKQTSRINKKESKMITKSPQRPSIKAMMELIELAKKHPQEVWDAFQPWYDRYTIFRWPIPAWIIEKIENEEVFIHLFDYGIDGILEYVHNYCNRKKLDFSIEPSKDIVHEGFPYLCISKNGKLLLRIHDTSCSTNMDPYICVHHQAEELPLKILLDLFKRHIESKDVLAYRKFYKDRNDRIFGFYR